MNAWITAAAASAYLVAAPTGARDEPTSQDDKQTEAQTKPETDANADEGRGPAMEMETTAQLGYHVRNPVSVVGQLRAKPSASPAAAVGLLIGGTLRHRPSLQAYGVLGYRSSLGMRSTFEDAGGTPRQPRVRSHDANLDFGLRSSVGRRPGVLRIGAALGYMLRPYHPEVKLGFPGYVLHGPTVAPTLNATLGNGVIRLNIAPRAGFGVVTHSRAANAPSVYGVVAGGAVGLAFRVYRRVHFELNYREQHGMLRGDGSQFHDVARWATAGLSFIHQSPRETKR